MKKNEKGNKTLEAIENAISKCDPDKETAILIYNNSEMEEGVSVSIGSQAVLVNTLIKMFDYIEEKGNVEHPDSALFIAHAILYAIAVADIRCHGQLTEAIEWYKKKYPLPIDENEDEHED